MLKALARNTIEVRLDVVLDEAVMKQAVTDHGKLESKGWKGQHGTAINIANSQGRFYCELLEAFANKREARVFRLYFDEQLAASLLTIERNGMLVILKTTYDEAMSNYSPGRLVDYFALQKLFEDESIRLVEWYTDASKTDKKWATGERDITNINYFRSNRIKNLIKLARKARAKFQRG